MAEKNKLYWLSWYEKSEDCRPLRYPPGEQVLGWWISGERCSDGAATICAYVKASSEADAWKAIDEDWPDSAREVRFCNQHDKPIVSDRFPVDDGWMRERFEANQK